MKEFSHGGDIYSFAKSIGCNIDEVIDLSSNINFIKPYIDIDFNKLDIQAYPSYDNLYNAISKKYNIDKDFIQLFNGGTTAINSLFKHLNLKNCDIYSPAYLEYKRCAKIFKYNIKLINRFENITNQATPNSFVIFVNPSTPDGLYYNIDELMNEWIDKNCTILIDESFLDFTDYKSAIPYLYKYDKLYILKSMTKIYSSAGIRIGTLLSQADNIKAIKEKESIWNISEFDSNYIQSALRDKDFKNISDLENRKAKDYLLNILAISDYIEKIYPSDANFILVKLKNINAVDFQKILSLYKIMVRDCSNFDGLDDKFVRIAVKDISLISQLASSLIVHL